MRRQDAELDYDSEARRFIELAESDTLRSPAHLQTGHTSGGIPGGPEDGMARLKEAFRSLDSNNDGKLGFEEVQGLLARTMMQPDPQSRPAWAPPGAGIAGAVGTDGRWAPRADAATGRESPSRGGFGGFRQNALGLQPGAAPSPSGGYPVEFPPWGPANSSRELLNGDPSSDDPWSAILSAGTEEFCVVPAVTLERLRAVGEAQLAEIEALRAEISRSPEVKDETIRLESTLEELEVGRVCAENELELRRLEAGKLAQEASHLRQQRDALVGQVREAKARVEQLEQWLEPSRGPPQASRAEDGPGLTPHRAEEGSTKQGLHEAFYK